MVPVRVMASRAYGDLPHYAQALLFAFAAQYRGGNNGALALTFGQARKLGVRSKGAYALGVRLLVERGLLIRTKQGGPKPLGPSLYALGWRAVDECGGKHEARPTITPPDTWREWRPEAPVQQAAAPQRDRRRTPLGPRADRESPISGPRADRDGPVIGTAGGPPSISRDGVSVLPAGSGRAPPAHVGPKPASGSVPALLRERANGAELGWLADVVRSGGDK